MEENFEKILDNAINGDKKCMEILLEMYSPLIDGLVKTANKKIDKQDFRQYLLLKFVENTKKFKKN